MLRCLCAKMVAECEIGDHALGANSTRGMRTSIAHPFVGVIEATYPGMRKTAETCSCSQTLRDLTPRRSEESRHLAKYAVFEIVVLSF